MKRNMFNYLCATACLVAGMASTSAGLAASTGTNYISGPNQMDMYKFNCPAGSPGGFVYISDLPFIANPNQVGVTIAKNKTSSTADATEDNISGQPVPLDNGQGTYYLVYRQYGALNNTEDYSSDVFCRNASGLLIPPVPGSFRIVLNQ